MSKLIKGVVFALACAGATAAYAQPTVLMKPDALETTVGSEFTITIGAKDYTDLQRMHSYDISVTYDSLCIESMAVTEGDFLKKAGATTVFKAGTINNILGIVAETTETLPGVEPGVTGSGDLFSITFKAIAECASNHIFFDPSSAVYNPVPTEIRSTYTSTVVVIKGPPAPPVSGDGIAVGTLLVTTGATLDKGNVYVWGWRGTAQQGNGHYNLPSNAAPQQVQSLSNVKSLTAGEYHLAALDENGDVWGWGQNIYGESGCGPSAYYYVATPCNVLSNVKQIAAGAVHTIARDDSGQVWTWGSNAYGQLGVGVGYGFPPYSKSPVAVNLNGEKATIIGASYYANFAVTEEGHVWAWGPNQTNGLGLPFARYGLRETAVPTRVALLEPYAAQIKSIAGGIGWGEALLNDGRVIGWGLKAALGQNTVSPRYFSPEPIVVMEGVESLFARYNGSFALTKTGQLYTWGIDQLGCHYKRYGALNMIYGRVPTLRANVVGKPTSIGGGKHHLFYNNEAGELYGIGLNDRFKLVQYLPSGYVVWPGSKIFYK